MQNQSAYYSDYLQLDKVLQAQHPASFRDGNLPAHDEMLFIIEHQAFELWFKQILFELDYICSVFQKERINDNSEDLSLALHRLNRIRKIMDVLIQQVTILDTMTPLDFLAFRDLLTPASGFQSVQFRLIEARLGLRMEKRHQASYYKRTNQGGFTQEDFDRINKEEEKDSLLKSVGKWLERMPFFDPDLWSHYQSIHPVKGQHPFWSDYREIYRSGLTEREKSKIHDFDYIFFEQFPEDLSDTEKERLQSLRWSFSSAAMRSALFTMLYRDFPLFQNSFRILDALIELDNLMAGWRHAHYRMVRRMIGMRVGTGNTTGAGYLEGAVSSHYVFRELAGLSTFLIQRSRIPELPVDLIRKLSFSEG